MLAKKKKPYTSIRFYSEKYKFWHSNSTYSKLSPEMSGTFDSCVSLYFLRIIWPFPFLLYSSSYAFVRLSLQEK